jgi:hypothetical protein
MADNSEEGQGPQRAVAPMMMMMKITPMFIRLNKNNTKTRTPQEENNIRTDKELCSQTF